MAKGRNSVVMAVRVPDSVKDRVKMLAEKEGWTVNEWVKVAIMKAAGLLSDGCASVWEE